MLVQSSTTLGGKSSQALLLAEKSLLRLMQLADLFLVPECVQQCAAALTPVVSYHSHVIILQRCCILVKHNVSICGMLRGRERAVANKVT